MKTVAVLGTLLLPALLLAQTPPVPSKAAKASEPPKGFLKPGGPPAVRLQCEPAGNGQFHLTISFYSERTGKLERLACSGSLDAIEEQIQCHVCAGRLPHRQGDLVEVALKRLRTIR